MFRQGFNHFALFLLFVLSTSASDSTSQSSRKRPEQPETSERMAVASGNVGINLDPARLNGAAFANEGSKRETLHFEVKPNSFFTILVFNSTLRAIEPSEMG